MDESDFPAIYKSADSLSASSQKNFLRALKSHLLLLVFAAVLSAISDPSIEIVIVQIMALLAALGCSIYLFAVRPDKLWYSSRAVAESVKTITWRFVCKAEPFDGPCDIAESSFRKRLGQIVEQNRGVAQAAIFNIEDSQVTTLMKDIRAKNLRGRQEIYKEFRIQNQLKWYVSKAKTNRDDSKTFFLLLVLINATAVLSALLRTQFMEVSFWYTDIFVAAAASLLSWMQAKRYSELAASYALTAHEISLIREQAFSALDDPGFSKFVGDSENAFSREHTQWCARRDM